MCEELNEQLEIGNNLAENLALHVHTMGAGNATIPVYFSDGDAVIIGKVFVELER